MYSLLHSYDVNLFNHPQLEISFDLELSRTQPNNGLSASARDNKQKITPKIFNPSPTTANGYFIFAQHYREQNDFDTALSIYLEALKSISTDDPQYILLLSEKKKLVAKFEQLKQGGFYHLLPLDVLYLIFGKLEYKDLLRCTRVCRLWFNFMKEWPEFWRRVSSGIPNLDRSTINSLLHGQIQILSLNGPVNPEYIHDTFSLLSLWEDDNFIQNICFQDLEMSTSNVQILGNATRCMLSSLKQLKWVSCKINPEDIIQNVLPACLPGMAHVSLSRHMNPSPPNIYYTSSNSHRPRFTITLNHGPENKVILEPTTATNYTMLTHLKVDTGYSNLRQEYGIHNTCNLLKFAITSVTKCPNLVYLSLVSYSSDVNLSNCFLKAIKSCPRLKTLVVSGVPQLPQTIIYDVNSESEYCTTTRTATTSSSSNDNNAFCSTTDNMSKTSNEIKRTATNDGVTTDAPGLRHLVLAHYNLDIKRNQILQMFENQYASLELLYLDYKGRKGATALLNKIGSGSFPRLREIHLLSSNPSSMVSNSTHPLMTKALIRLFSVCPVLEVVELENVANDIENIQDNNGSLIETIANHCLQLRHLCISFSRGINYDYSSKDFLRFINRNCTSNKNSNDKSIKSKDGKTETEQCESQLEYLKTSGMDLEVAYAMIQNLKSLKYLHVATWWVGSIQSNQADVNGDDDDLLELIRKTLEERGGSLVTGSTNT